MLDNLILSNALSALVQTFGAQHVQLWSLFLHGWIEKNGTSPSSFFSKQVASPRFGWFGEVRGGHRAAAAPGGPGRGVVP